jgi:hypothetical protein
MLKIKNLVINPYAYCIVRQSVLYVVSFKDDFKKRE